MKWIGLTGGIASGKSTVSQLLRDRGRVVIDADELAREVVQPGTEGLLEILQTFGQGLLNTKGELDRTKLGQVVFQDAGRLSQLEKILHPRIRKLADERRRQLQAKGVDAAFYDVPLLFEKKMQSLFDLIIVVSCAPEQQLQRLMARNGFSKEHAQARMAAQIPLVEKANAANFVIENSGTKEQLSARIDQLLAQLQLK